MNNKRKRKRPVGSWSVWLIGFDGDVRHFCDVPNREIADRFVSMMPETESRRIALPTKCGRPMMIAEHRRRKRQ